MGDALGGGQDGRPVDGAGAECAFPEVLYKFGAALCCVGPDADCGVYGALVRARRLWRAGYRLEVARAAAGPSNAPGVVCGCSYAQHA